MTINGLLPGAFDTDRLRGDDAGAPRRRPARTSTRCDEARRPASRRSASARADEFGAVCAFLCSVQAGYLTGQNILLDGGAYPGTF